MKFGHSARPNTKRPSPESPTKMDEEINRINKIQFYYRNQIKRLPKPESSDKINEKYTNYTSSEFRKGRVSKSADTQVDLKEVSPWCSANVQMAFEELECRAALRQPAIGGLALVFRL